MKKLITGLVFSLLILMACVSPILADGASVVLDLTEMQRYEMADSLCWIDDSLYVLGNKGVYSWKSGSEKMNTVIDLAVASNYDYVQDCPEDESEATVWNQMLQLIFTDGEALYGLHPYSGMIKKIEGNAQTDVAEIQREYLYSEDMEAYREIRQAVYADKKLYLLLGTDTYEEYDKTELYAFDLDTSEMELVDIEGVNSIMLGAEGTLLIQTNDALSSAVQYDVESGTLGEEILTVGEDERIAGVAWDAVDQRYVRFVQGQVITCDADGNEIVKAYIPVFDATENVPAACSATGLYALANGRYIFIRDITGDEAASQTILTVAGYLNPDMLIQFSLDNPDIAVLQSSQSAQNAALSGDYTVDMFTLTAPGDFAAMKEKGYLASMQDGQLCDWSKTLYQEIQNVIYIGEELLAAPIAINVNSWTMDETMWNELELGEYPTNYDELFEKIAVWLDDYASEYPDYTLSDIQQNGMETLVAAVMKDYIIQNADQGGQFTFKTDAFRNVLMSIAAHAELLSEEHDQWGMPILSSYSQGFGVSYNDSHRVVMMLPPALNADGEQAMNTEIEVLAIHNASKNKDIAEKFIAWYVAHLSDTVSYELSLEKNEPIENPNYPIRVQEVTDELQDLKKKLEETDDPDKQAELEEQIFRKENQLEGLADMQWSISQESIDCYRSVAKNMKIAYESPFFSSGEGGGMQAVNDVIAKFCEDGLVESEVDGLISELDRVTFMVSMEGR
mgnify:FL=1